MSKNNFNNNRREFLRKSAIILAGAGIPIYLQRNIFKNLGQLLLPSAQAAGGNQIYWVLEMPIRATYTFGNWFPAPGLVSSPLWNQFGVVGFTGDKNGLINASRMRVSAEAAALAPHTDNIAIFECGYPMEADHRPLWSFRVGCDTGFLGRDELRDNPASQNLPATIAPLFAHAVGNVRSPRPAMGGARLGFTGQFRIYDVHNSLRPLETINNFDQIRGYLNAEVPVGTGGTTGGTTDGSPTGGATGSTTGGTGGGTEENLIRRTDFQLTIEAIRRINKLQEAQFLSVRYDRMAQVRSVADEGLSYLGSLVAPAASSASVRTAALRNTPEEFAELRAQFGCGVPVGDEPCDLGDALMTAYVGFRENVFPSACLGVFMNHIHLIPEFGTGDVGTLDSLAKIRAQDLQLTSRLGTFIDKLKTTASPFGGGTMFDHTLIVLSSESLKPMGYQDTNGRRNWGHGERWGGVFIGGNVRGGYYGDMDFTRVEVDDDRARGFTPGRRTIGFDPNSGATVMDSKPTPGMIYRTVCEMAQIPENEIQAQMARGATNGPSMNIFKA